MKNLFWLVKAGCVFLSTSLATFPFQAMAGARGGVGEEVQAGDVAITLIGVDVGQRVGQPPLVAIAQDGAQYVVLTYRYKNISPKPLPALKTPSLVLIDAGGTTYKPEFGATAAYAATAKLSEKILSDLNPQISSAGSAVFEVATSLFNKSTWTIGVSTDSSTRLSLIDRNATLEGLTPRAETIDSGALKGTKVTLYCPDDWTTSIKQKGIRLSFTCEKPGATDSDPAVVGIDVWPLDAENLIKATGLISTLRSSNKIDPTNTNIREATPETEYRTGPMTVFGHSYRYKNSDGLDTRSYYLEAGTEIYPFPSVSTGYNASIWTRASVVLGPSVQNREAVFNRLKAGIRASISALAPSLYAAIKGVPREQSMASVAPTNPAAEVSTPENQERTTPQTLLSVPRSISPSFDCGKASQESEKLICADKALADLDVQLQSAYRGTMTSDLSDSTKADIKASQRAWIASRNQCHSASCIEASYHQRIEQICALPANGLSLAICKTPGSSR